MIGTADSDKKRALALETARRTRDSNANLVADVEEITGGHMLLACMMVCERQRLIPTWRLWGGRVA